MHLPRSLRMWSAVLLISPMVSIAMDIRVYDSPWRARPPWRRWQTGRTVSLCQWRWRAKSRTCHLPKELAAIPPVAFRRPAGSLAAGMFAVYRARQIRTALSYSARRYHSAICCSKMSCDAFLSEALYEADKALEKFAAAPRECAFFKMADGADGVSQMCILFGYFA